MKRSLLILAGCLSVQAATIQLGQTSTGGGQTVAASGSTATPNSNTNLVLTHTAGGVTVEVRAFSLMNGTGNFSNAALQPFGTSIGLGVCNSREISSRVCDGDDWQVSSAAIDTNPNPDNRYRDFVLLTFTNGPVDLVSLILQQTSRTAHDSDMTYWTSTSAINTLTSSTLAGFGGGTVGYGDTLQASQFSWASRTQSLTGTGVRTLLIAAGGGTNPNDDFFKLLTLTTNPSTVPEPGSMALLGSGLIGLGLLARRRRG